MRSSLVGLMAFGIALGAWPEAQCGESRAPVVVELFTSQGCNSCPPADAYLGELAKRGDVLPLAFHVDYWDYIGWKDPFAQRQWTDRQRAYSRSLGLRTIYTPQVVVQGSIDAVGSDRRAVAQAIAKAKAGAAFDLAARRSGDGIVLSLAEAAGVVGEVWIVGYDPKHETRVLRGENAGKTLTEFNIVRGLRRAGLWNGTAQELTVKTADLPEGQAHVAIVQSPGWGRILAAVTIGG
jgi:hypothetical protein